MKKLLERAGASFLRAFGAALIVLAPGILAAPDLNGAVVLASAALIASLTAGLKALQVFVPQLSLQHWISGAVGAWADSFLRAFVGALITLLVGVLAAPDLATAKTLAVAALVGAFAAGLRALQGAFTEGEVPLPQSGMKV